MNFEQALQGLAPKLRDPENGLRYARNLWCSLANCGWRGPDGEVFDASWRYLGALVADLRGMGDHYMDFYCCDAPGETDVRYGQAWPPIVAHLAALGCELVYEQEDGPKI